MDIELVGATGNKNHTADNWAVTSVAVVFSSKLDKNGVGQGVDGINLVNADLELAIVALLQLSFNLLKRNIVINQL